MVNEFDVKTIRKEYPKGTVLKCLTMNDPYHPIPNGMIGTVKFVDDAGTIHMSWENGSSLGLILGEDEFVKVKEERR